MYVLPSTMSDLAAYAEDSFPLFLLRIVYHASHFLYHAPCVLWILFYIKYYALFLRITGKERPATFAASWMSLLADQLIRYPKSAAALPLDNSTFVAPTDLTRLFLAGIDGECIEMQDPARQRAGESDGRPSQGQEADAGSSFRGGNGAHMAHVPQPVGSASDGNQMDISPPKAILPMVPVSRGVPADLELEDEVDAYEHLDASSSVCAAQAPEETVQAVPASCYVNQQLSEPEEMDIDTPDCDSNYSSPAESHMRLDSGQAAEEVPLLQHRHTQHDEKQKGRRVQRGLSSTGGRDPMTERPERSRRSRRFGRSERPERSERTGRKRERVMKKLSSLKHNLSSKVFDLKSAFGPVLDEIERSSGASGALQEATKRVTPREKEEEDGYWGLGGRAKRTNRKQRKDIQRRKLRKFAGVEESVQTKDQRLLDLIRRARPKHWKKLRRRLPKDSRPAKRIGSKEPIRVTATPCRPRRTLGRSSSLRRHYPGAGRRIAASEAAPAPEPPAAGSAEAAPRPKKWGIWLLLDEAFKKRKPSLRQQRRMAAARQRNSSAPSPICPAPTPTPTHTHTEPPSPATVTPETTAGRNRLAWRRRDRAARLGSSANRRVPGEK